MTKLSKQEIERVQKVSGATRIIDVTQENTLLEPLKGRKGMKGFFNYSVLYDVRGNYAKTRTHSLKSFKSFLVPYIGEAYAYEYENRLVEKMVLASTESNNSIELTDGEIIDLEGLSREEIDQLARKKAGEPLQDGSEGRTLLNEIVARPDINYDLGNQGKNGRFCKINNRVYYVIGDEQPDPRRNNLAYDLTDTPVPLFIAYVIVSHLFDYLLPDDEESPYFPPGRYWSWEDVFYFLFDPRFQEDCFRILDINNVCKIRVLVPWTNLLKRYFEYWGDSNVSGFDEIYSESGDKTETCIERDSAYNFLRFLGVDPAEAAYLGEKSTSCKGIKEVILSLDRFIESQIWVKKGTGSFHN